MNNDLSLMLIENLLDRVERDELSGKWRLQGVISEKERQALIDACICLGGSPPKAEEIRIPVPLPMPFPDEFELQNENEQVLEEVQEEVQVQEPKLKVDSAIEIDKTCLDLDAPENEEVILCLDFGTAMSKAFATRETDMDLLDLAIGRRAIAGVEHALWAVNLQLPS